MSKRNGNVWLRRFEALDDDKEIRRRATSIGIPIHNLAAVPTYRVVQQIEEALSNLYIPSEAEVGLLRKFVDVARSHCWRRYENHESYLSLLYQPYQQFETHLIPPHCLTGPAGVGKTALIRALGRVLPSNSELELGPAHPTVNQVAAWSLEVRTKATLKEMLAPFVGSELGGARRINHGVLSRICAKSIHRSGVGLIVADEMQFLTQSATANTQITKLLYQLSHLGAPLLFVANYSMCQLLLRRREQDRQRLLTSPSILLPLTPDSDDWRSYLLAIQTVLGQSLKIDLQLDADAVYLMTAGLKRFVVRLISLSYGNAWTQGKRSVRIEDLDNAYESAAYSSNRSQVKAMLSPSHSQQAQQYLCPFPIPPTQRRAFQTVRDRFRQQELTSKVQQDIMTPVERKTAAKSGKVLPSASHGTSASARSRTKRPPLSAQELMDTERRRQGGNSRSRPNEPRT